MSAQSWKDKYSTNEEVVVEAANFTAFATGGQTNATALNKKFNRVNVCATDGDSVKLITSLIGMKQYVFNDTVHTLSIFPVSGGYINGVLNAEIKIFAGDTAIFECQASGKWICYTLGAITPTVSGGIVQTFAFKVSLSAAQIKTANSVPIDIGLPASGAGYYYRVTAFDVNLTFGTIAFDNATELDLMASSLASNEVQFTCVLLAATSNTFQIGHPANYITPTNSIVENDTLSLSVDMDSTVGDSTIDCYITVEKVKL